MFKRVPVGEVQMGMFIQEFLGAWVDHPFWRSRFLLDNPRDLQRIRQSDIAEVLIDVSRSRIRPAAVEALPEVDVAPVAEQAVAGMDVLIGEAPAVQPWVPMEEELSRARLLCERAKGAVMEMFRDARMGRAIDIEQVDGLVEEISASVLRHPNVLISLARLKHADEYTYLHSVAVCALMIALARQLGLPEELVRELGRAGLLHDVGKMAIPNEVLNKPGALDDAEMSLVRQHPEAGGRILLESKQAGALVLDVCLHHHEKYDGSGYPHGLAGEQISLPARMGAVCDVYDAVTSNRPYKKGWDPAESIRRMASWSGHFDEKVFQAFVKCLGIYPVGALVRLESGRLAVVIEQHPESLLTPKVRVFFSARSKLPLAQETVDLARLDGKDRIVGREDPQKWGFRRLDELWGASTPE